MDKTLYIFGNGFDIAHGINTSYWAFRTYLSDNYDDFLMQFEKMYNIERLDDTEPWYTSAAQRRWEDSINKEFWSFFEQEMGNPNASEMEGFSSCIIDDLDLEGGNIGIESMMDAYWDDQYGFINQLNNYILEWAEQIDITKVCTQNSSLIECEDALFLTFNYTSILEDIYHIDSYQILHIHGGITSISDTSPIIGHGNTTDIVYHRQQAQSASDVFDEGTTSIHNAIANFIETTHKDTSSIIENNHLFFSKLKNITTINILGWSIGNVDVPYLIKIRDSVPCDTQWNIYYYSQESLAMISKVISEIAPKINVQYISSNEFWDIK